MAAVFRRFVTSCVCSRKCSVVVYFASGKRNIHSRYVAPTLREINRRIKIVGQKVHPRNTWIEWNYNAEIFAFGKRLSEEFNEEMLRQAFVCQSYILKEKQEQKEIGVSEVKLDLQSSDDLAADGEKVMSSYIKAYLRAALCYFPEEGINAIHNYLMSEEVLAHISTRIGTKDLILCEEYPPNVSNLVTTLKAVVGALVHSTDIENTKLFIQDFVLTQLVNKDINDLWEIVNPMGVLVNILKLEGRGEPEPRLIREGGKNTILAVYYVGIYSDMELIGTGPGESVEIAQEMAARDALKRLFHTVDSMDPLPLGKKGRELKPVEDRENISVTEWSTDKVKNIIMC